ncbi:hypothetical protein HKD37_01G000677 [Glycine soja]
MLNSHVWKMATPPSSPPPPPPPTDTTSQSPSTLKQTRKATWLRSLVTKPARAERPVVHVDPATGKADGPHKKKLRTYLGIVTRDKVDMAYKNWKQVPAAQMDLIWEDIQPTRIVSMTLYVKNMTLAWRNGPNFVTAAETLRGRIGRKRHRPSKNKTLPPMCCLVGVMNV